MSNRQKATYGVAVILTEAIHTAGGTHVPSDTVRTLGRRPVET